MGLFMSQKIVNKTFFTDDWVQKFFFTGKSVYFYTIDDFFDVCIQWQTNIKLICKVSLTKKLFRTHLTFLSKFHVVYRSQPEKKIDDRPLFKLGVLCYIYRHFELLQNKYFLRH